MHRPIPIAVIAPESSDILKALGESALVSRLSPAVIVTSPPHFELARSVGGPRSLYPIAQAHAGVFPECLEGSNLGASGKLLSDLQSWMPTVLTLIDRKNWSGASVQAMHRLATKYVSIWSAILDRFKPELILWHDVPQRGFDLVLYGLCRLRGIRIGIVGFTSLRDRLVIQEAIDGPVVPLFQSRPSLSIDDASHMLDSFYSKRIIPDQMDVARNLRTTMSIGDGLRRRAMALGSVPLRFPEVVPDRKLSRGSRIASGLRNRRLIRAAHGEYESAASVRAPTDDRPFIYCALHFQPEATTVPRGGVQWDQINNLRVLAEGLPPGWSVVAKEHPMMMSYRWDWHRARGAAYYEELMDIPRVSLAPLSSSSSALIQRASAVVTTTGTVGWESLLAGKPVAVFGYPWYASAPNVTLVHSQEEVELWARGLNAGAPPAEVAKSTLEFVRTFVPRSTFFGRWQEAALGTEDAMGLDSVAAYCEAVMAFVDRPA